MKSNVLLFERPSYLQATAPPENRDVNRDGVRLLVTTSTANIHARFTDLHEFLEPGDLLVVNESATVPASLPAERPMGSFILNLSSDYGNGLWVAEPRWSPVEPGPLPFLEEGQHVEIPGLTVRLVSRYPGLERLWFVRINGNVAAALENYGSPIRYGYMDQAFPLDYYQTIFASVPGSAEMPSAARPFTQEVVDRLRIKGVEIAPIVLHTGVSSLEVTSKELEDQVMYPEPFEVPASTAQAVNDAKHEGRNIVAVGTTVVRALESAWDGGQVCPISGFTKLYIHPDRGISVVDGLVTGFHDPMASHLAMLYALADEKIIRSAYTEAVKSRYLWHEFGDSNLILPRASATQVGY